MKVIPLDPNNKYYKLLIDCILLLFALSYCLYGWQYFNMNNYVFDEGISVYGAVHILDGHMPYRDFWTYHAPGRFYLLAGIFKLFGISLRTAVLLAIFTIFLISWGIYKFTSKTSSIALGIFALLLSLAWFKSFMVYNRPWQFAMLFYVFCCFILLEYLLSKDNKWIFIMGVFIGIIGLFRMDFELYVAVSLFLVILLKNNNDLKNNSLKIKIISFVKNSLLLLSGNLLVSIPNLIYFIHYGGFKEFNNYVLSGTWHINRYFPFPACGIKTFIFYIPILVFIFISIQLLLYNYKNKPKDNIYWLKIFFLFSGIFLYYYTTRRMDISHLLPAMIPVLIMFTLMCNDLLKKTVKSPVFYNCFLFLTFFICCWMLLYSLKPYFKAINKISKDINKSVLDIPRAKYLFDPSEFAQSQIQTVKYIQAKTDKNDKIFVGNTSHRKIVYNDVMFYFLSDRHSATKYYQLEPGFTNTQLIQKKIINDLIKENVQYIVLCSAFENINEPNNSNKSTNINDLDDFIRENYKLDKKLGYYSILKQL